jgi:hypothetical protein
MTRESLLLGDRKPMLVASGTGGSGAIFAPRQGLSSDGLGEGGSPGN